MNSREQFLKDRQTGIGSSDAPKVLGLSPYGGPLDVYFSKVAELTPELDVDKREPWKGWGQRLEPVILQHYADVHGFELRRPGQLRHPRHEFMIANIDALRSDNALIEAKTSRTSFGFGEPGTDEIPQEYILQVQHAMLVLEAVIEVRVPYAIVPVLIAGSDYREYTVEADAELQSMILDAEADFWQCVERKTPPPPRTAEEARRLFPHSTPGAVVQANADIMLRIAELEQARRDLDLADKKCDALKAYIQTYMADAEALIYEGETVCTWKRSRPSMRVDLALLKEKFPAVYAECGKPTEGSRRFLLKD